MNVTTQQLAQAFAAKNMSIQWLNAGAGREKVPCTAGTITLESIVDAIAAIPVKNEEKE